MSTSWNNPTHSETNWSPVSQNPTSYTGRETVDKGAIMDDLTYTMDSLLINMDDMKFTSYTAEPTNWT